MNTQNKTNKVIQLLNEIRESIKYDYLPEDWHDNKENLVYTESGYYSLAEDCIQVNDVYYHSDNDSDSYYYDELSDEYKDDDNMIMAYGKRGNEFITSLNNNEIVKYNGDYYHRDYLSDNDLVELHNGDICNEDNARYVEDEGDYYHYEDVYYWESDGQYHLEEEEEEEEEDTLFSYHSKSSKDYSNGSLYKIGFEIEKSQLPSFSFNANELYNDYGFRLEKDSSVDKGFELITPIYNLFDEELLNKLDKVEGFINVPYVENAGGHINYSIRGKNDSQIFDSVKSFIPLIFAMYKKRLNNSYCESKKFNELKNSSEKMQSIRMRNDYIEFRLIASVKNYDCLKFRINFFKLMSQNENISFPKLFAMLTDENSKLYKLLRSDVYSDDNKYKRLLNDTIYYRESFGDAITPIVVNKLKLMIQNKIK
jgi:hypothetical protein